LKLSFDSSVDVMLRIAIVDPSDYSRDPLRSLLLGVDFVWLESECSRYEFFPDVIGQSPPDLAIVVLDSDHQRALNMISQVATVFPKLPILTISSDHQALLQSLQRGARYFLTQPVGLEEMLATLRRVQMENGVGGTNGTLNGTAGHGCRVIAILGSRGGVGCTSLAVNLGCDLAADPNHSVVLLDLDMALGDADISLDLIPDHTLADLAINIERLDMNFLKRSMMRHEGTGLHVLSHPLQISDVGVIHEDHVSRIINLLRISHTHLILDLSKALIPTDMTALRLADTIFIIAQLELGSLRNVVRILLALGDDDQTNHKVRVIMNRVGSDYAEGDISLKKAEETIGRPIYWQIPNDTKAMIGSRVAGVPLIQYAPKSRAHQAIYALAQTLATQTDEATQTPRPVSSSFFKRLVGR
jgi:pilus assembly protein CpaE